jgi:hypothetical protein
MPEKPLIGGRIVSQWIASHGTILARVTANG